MPSRQKHYHLSLHMNNPQEAEVARLLDQAKKGEGIKTFIVRAIQHYVDSETDAKSAPPTTKLETALPAEDTTADTTALAEAIQRINPGITREAAQALAASDPLNQMRILYAAFTHLAAPERLTEIEALLLRDLAHLIETLLAQVASQRPSIRQILTDHPEE